MKQIYFIALLLGLYTPLAVLAQKSQSRLSGKIVDTKGQPIPGASVQLEGQSVGAIANEKGWFEIEGDFPQELKLRVSFLGYEPYSKVLTVESWKRKELKIVLNESSLNLEEVLVTGKSVLSEVKEQAFNVSVVDAKALHGTNLDVGHALDRISGVRVRESGGVGSDMNFSLNGFRGKQVRFFIDGVPMDNFGSSFQLNNIPINVAQRIEVYKGVVPIGLGSDALGGAVNIITDSYEKSSLSVSYSYGSFNTHKSFIQGVFVGKSGFTAKVNAYQNYSDNNYKMHVDVADINTGEYFRNQTVRRFNDTFHNQVLMVDLGLVKKPIADEFFIGATLGKNYKEIQTGARVAAVYGDIHRKGNILMPKFKYVKNDLFAKGLNLRVNGNFNFGEENYIDTVHRRYNWLGQFKEYPNAGGERSYSDYQYKNNNGLLVASMQYAFNEVHHFSASSTYNTFNRIGHNRVNPDDETYEHPRKTQKNIAGLGYSFRKEAFNASVFLKEYHQKNTYMFSYNPTGNYGDVAYRLQETTYDKWGYGLALTSFLTENFQIKASYEKSYRLPENEELFGDVVNLQGNIDLKPESSHNYNLGLNHWWRFGKTSSLQTGFGGFYRLASDFIRARLNNNQVMQVMENLGNVINKGLEAEVRYQYKRKGSVGFNLTYQDLRNNTQFEGDSQTESVIYKDRIPNMPYFYGNADANYNFSHLWKASDQLSLGYNLLYVHAFFLYWPSLGNDKLTIPTQVSHDLSLSYALNNRMKFTFACKNFTSSRLYDNFSLQKPGISFSGKIQYKFF
ncbi:TonB-dependent receptor [Marinilongibacter aquaticus]|uniref:TonB-dependent receptor n=1 Tax=Marinilongibacter aquaticus TaxID=2975157 RepID=UPI0021BDAE1C|nr:TonB-dependent receptor [Marinilongibacter aquaticus]UBM59138.1 TonB-dependent receptor [Marinilongibacter aquaticus]